MFLQKGVSENGHTVHPRRNPGRMASKWCGCGAGFYPQETVATAENAGVLVQVSGLGISWLFEDKLLFPT